MNCSKTFLIHLRQTLVLALMAVIWSACDSTKHIPEGQYLLRKNTLKVKSDVPVTKRGEFNDQLHSLVVQKPNNYSFGVFPFKLWLYNSRYSKYQRDTTNYQIKSKTVEKPVIYDSLLQRRTEQNLKAFLFNQGFFYAKVRDTVVKKKKKAYVTYNIETGTNYLINNIKLDVDDSTIKQEIQAMLDETYLKKGTDFSMSLLDEEMSRITNNLQDIGYVKFTQSNITFVLDTMNKNYFRNAENPFETAINFLALQKQQKRPTLDVKIVVRADDDSSAYFKYYISKVVVYPDNLSADDFRDSTLQQSEYNDITFRYHHHYVHDEVVARHIYLNKGDVYSQTNLNQTITKLNELGVFQTVRIYHRDDTTVHDRHAQRCVIVMTPSKKYDFTTNFEVSNGSTYSLGGALTVSFRDHNLASGANLLSTSVSGGIESAYYPSRGDNLLEHFFLLSKNVGFNANLDMPKFLVPFRPTRNDNANLPRTIFGAGFNLLDRVDYFTLTNTAASLSYAWRETPTKTWNISPAFINIQRLPRVADSFQKRMNENDFLRNSYKENFIEGENLTFTFTNPNTRAARFGYSYVNLGVEEAGTVLSAVHGLGQALNNLYSINQYAQYVKFDFDLRRFINIRKSVAAVRFYGGVGIPYDKSTTLPYIKQYFVGGAYSIRGWRVRSLGPGATPPDSVTNYIDRTGDIKLEMNAEYRFPIVQLFSGAMKLNGALFADAGNIWLARKSSEYPNGTLDWTTFGHDIAMSTGAGARVDIGGFFVIRFDLAFPLKKPYVAENGGWVLKQIAPYDSDWRDQNLILNIAIGYPF